MATLRVQRPSQYADWLRKYRIFVDGSPVGDISAGSDSTFEVSQGRREVLARIDWCSSNSVNVEIEDAHECTLEVGSNLNGWRLLLGFLYITFWRSDYLYLREVDSGQ